MSKKQIKAEFRRERDTLNFEYKQDKQRRKHQFHLRKQELKLSGDKKTLREEKRAYKNEAYMQKAIRQQKEDRLKLKEREALDLLVGKVTEHAPESLVGGLMLHYILIFLLVGLLQAGFIIFATDFVMQDRATETMLAVAGSLEAGDLDGEIAARLAEENEMNITLYDSAGKQLYSFGMEEYQGSLPYNQRWEEPFTYQQKTEELRIYSKKTAQGQMLNLAKSMEEEGAILSVVVNLMLFSIVGALLISYFVGYRITRKELRPIGILGRAMKEVSASNLSDRLETENISTELVEVVHSYNGMLDKIEEAYERQKQFVSDASHELRTPLAVIHGYADILSRWGAEDPAVRKEAVEAILAQSENMQTLLERLLYIARSESGKLKMRLQKCALAPLCAEILQDFKMMHPDRTFLLEGEATALCDEGMIRQLLTILLDNAVKFTAEGGKISLSLGGEATLAVRDDGIGITPDIADRIFERFYKGDSSHNEKGYGLGLSIAKLIAESHQGKIWVETQEGAGATFFIQLP